MFRLITLFERLLSLLIVFLLLTATVLWDTTMNISMTSAPTAVPARNPSIFLPMTSVYNGATAEDVW